MGPVGDHARVIVDPAVPCNHKHVMRQIFPLINYPGVYPCAGYYACVINERIALAERHIQPIPPETPDNVLIWNEAFENLKKTFPPRKLRKLSWDELIKQSPTHRRARIANAAKNLHSRALTKKDVMVKSFLKWEKHQDNILDPLEAKAPRMIQHYSDEFCYSLMRWIKPLEKFLMYTKYNRRSRWSTKGMTPEQTAMKLRADWESIADPVAKLDDVSRLDAHMRRRILEPCYNFYMSFFPGDSSLRWHLDQMLHSKCRTSNGIYYEMDGTIKSGQPDTTLTDSCTVKAAAEYVYKTYPKKDSVLGDDSVIIASASRSPASERWLDFGFKTKPLDVYTFEQIEFCQCRPVERTPGCWTMVRKPERVFERSAYTDKTRDNSNAWKRLLASMATSELYQNSGIPVLQAWSMAMLRGADGAKPDAELDRIVSIRKLRAHTEQPIHECARASFAIAFGISVQEQLELEREIAEMPAYCPL
jgi:hypothetical protein